MKKYELKLVSEKYGLCHPQIITAIKMQVEHGCYVFYIEDDIFDDFDMVDVNMNVPLVPYLYYPVNKYVVKILEKIKN